MRLAITGGHLSPALSLIESLPPDTEILVVGRKRVLEGDSVLSLEYQKIKREKINFKSIVAGRLQRKWTRYTLLSILKFPYGFFQSLLILKAYKPDVVLSFGGYVSLPVATAAFFLRIPLVIHEQTLEAGMANKIAGLFAKKICISWESSRKFFPKSKVMFTGNPIREFSTSLPDGKASNFQYSIPGEKIPLIYITGGSSGSHAINLLVEGCIEKLLEKARVIHQTGDAQKYQDFARLEKLKNKFSFEIQKRYVLTKFVDPDNVGAVLKVADLVISRSGINTVMELASLSKPSLLIPLPYSQNKEQMKNALLLKEAGIAEVVDQNDLTPEKLYELTVSMTNNLKKYKPSREFENIHQDASVKIIEVLNSVKK